MPLPGDRDIGSEGIQPLRPDPAGGAHRAATGSEGRSPASAQAHAYWLRREQTARALAARATDRQIARIHLEMAERYAMLAAELDRSRG